MGLKNTKCDYWFTVNCFNSVLLEMLRSKQNYIILLLKLTIHLINHILQDPMLINNHTK